MPRLRGLLDAKNRLLDMVDRVVDREWIVGGSGLQTVDPGDVYATGAGHCGGSK